MQCGGQPVARMGSFPPPVPDFPVLQEHSWGQLLQNPTCPKPRKEKVLAASLKSVAGVVVLVNQNSYRPPASTTPCTFVVF